ncbi:MAG TPA: phosphoribosyltransferase family protein, partial [Gemmatimonadales bacterium]|nr:phosphoribosyltransferase family protein [Gemmatimonadales bacterium]
MLASTFADRVEAGRELAFQLDRFRGRPGLIVLGLPRGGVPVAAEVARLLHARLEPFVVRKLGVPGHEELAMGALASGGLRVLQPETIAMLGITPDQVAAVTAAESRELLRREELYRGGHPFPALGGETVILVDDGVATGATMLAALRAIRQRGPATLIAAAPVMSKQAFRALARVADAAVAVIVPDDFHAVGAWYDDFHPVHDGEVLAALDP